MTRFVALAWLLGSLAAPALAQDPDIPFDEFRLSNGLRVIVHTDRKAPIVAIQVWYHVGSKNEVPGKTGFAHLFEHLMFNGSENHNDEWFRPLQEVGATNVNGTTDFDRTNYFETVPKSAVDLALWMESDRMGHLVGAIDQKKLDEQRGVVRWEIALPPLTVDAAATKVPCTRVDQDVIDAHPPAAMERTAAIVPPGECGRRIGGCKSLRRVDEASTNQAQPGCTLFARHVRGTNECRWIPHINVARRHIEVAAECKWCRLAEGGTAPCAERSEPVELCMPVWCANLAPVRCVD